MNNATPSPVKEIDPTTPPTVQKPASTLPTKKNVVETENVKIVEISGSSSSRGPPKQ